MRGYLERCTGRKHEAVQAIDLNGRALANYRQTHLGPGATERGVSPGQWLTQVRIDAAGIGLLLGEDVLAPEPARALALAGTVTGAAGGFRIGACSADALAASRPRLRERWPLPSPTAPTSPRA